MHQVTRVAAAAATTPMLAVASRARAAVPERSLSMHHTHTGERLSLVFAIGDNYPDTSLGLLNRFLRDHYTGEVGRMDPALFDLLHRTRLVLGTNAPYEIISGYRAPQTNERLRQTGGGGVARRSLHMEGRAVDVRLTGVPLAELRDAAKSLQAGGVGYYPSQRFVHLDTGRVRTW